MADTEKTPTESQYEYSYRKDYESDWDVHRRYVQTLDPLEAMLIGQTFDAVSNSIDSSKITDSYTATLAIERAARVMGKLPDGQTESIGKGDMGKAALMDIIRQKWIYPNANSQYSFEIKMEMIQLYSDVYGYMPAFVDWNVNPNGYVGPDCWIWNPRNLVFQQGRNFFNEMDYVTALTWVGPSFLEEILDGLEGSGESESEDEAEGDTDDTAQGILTGEESLKGGEGWNIDALKELLAYDKGKDATNADSEKDTRVARTRVPQATKRGICLATRYEAGPKGQWIVFAPDHGYCEVRRFDNPHKNSRIPFRLKYSQELYDSVYGLGDFQRSKPLQFARDGLTNFYFNGIKMNLIPPIVVNANGVLKHTIDYRAGAVMMETIPNSVRRLETSNAGLATYQAAQTALTGSLLSLWGSQNASAPGAETLNPSQGKTPAAISLYGDKEASRDGRARKRLELFIEEITDAFFELIVNISTESIPINLFAKDIEAIDKSGLTDVTDIFKGFKPDQSYTGGTLVIDPSKLKDMEFRFNITPDSTSKVNVQAQQEELQNMMTTIAKFQNQFKDDPSIEVNWGEIMKSYEALSSVPGASQFVTMKTPEQVRQAQEQAAQAAAQAAQPKNPVQLPGGQVHEAADLAKMYVAPTTPDDVKNQILQVMGMQPSQMPSPVATDQAVKHATIMKQAADAQHQDRTHALAVATAAHQAASSAQAAQPEPVTPPEPTFAGGGAFRDPLMAAAAEHIATAAAPSKAPAPAAPPAKQ